MPKKHSKTFPLKKRRNEYGRLIRKAYESHMIQGIRRKDIREYAPDNQDYSGTITTVTHDNLMIERWED